MQEHCVGAEEGMRVGVPGEPFPQKPQEWGIPRLAKPVVNVFWPFGKFHTQFKSLWLRHSSLFLGTKVVSNATLYGICVYVQETQLP